MVIFTPPLSSGAKKEMKKKQSGLLRIIIWGVLIGGILALIGIGVLAVVTGLFFFSLLIFNKNFLATRRRAMRESRCTSASTWARKGHEQQQ
jgi:predicted lipid-binding transport protein (Tim44 family)